MHRTKTGICQCEPTTERHPSKIIPRRRVLCLHQPNQSGQAQRDSIAAQHIGQSICLGTHIWLYNLRDRVQPAGKRHRFWRPIGQCGINDRHIWQHSIIAQRNFSPRRWHANHSIFCHLSACPGSCGNSDKMQWICPKRQTPAHHLKVIHHRQTGRHKCCNRLACINDRAAAHCDDNLCFCSPCRSDTRLNHRNIRFVPNRKTGNGGQLIGQPVGARSCQTIDQHHPRAEGLGRHRNLTGFTPPKPNF